MAAEDKITRSDRRWAYVDIGKDGHATRTCLTGTGPLVGAEPPSQEAFKPTVQGVMEKTHPPGKAAFPRRMTPGVAATASSGNSVSCRFLGTAPNLLNQGF